MQIGILRNEDYTIGQASTKGSWCKDLVEIKRCEHSMFYHYFFYILKTNSRKTLMSHHDLREWFYWTRETICHWLVRKHFSRVQQIATALNQSSWKTIFCMKLVKSHCEWRELPIYPSLGQQSVSSLTILF